MISNGCKYQWNKSNKHYTNCHIEQLLFLSWLPLPNVISIPLARNLIGIMKHRRLLMRFIWSSFCKRHSSRTSYNSKTERLPHKIKLVHLRTVQIPTVNQYLSQRSAWPSNLPRVQRSHPLCKIMTLLCCSIFLCCKKLKHENPIISHKKNQW